jgi:hypothetical protein
VQPFGKPGKISGYACFAQFIDQFLLHLIQGKFRFDKAVVLKTVGTILYIIKPVGNPEIVVFVFRKGHSATLANCVLLFL